MKHKSTVILTNTVRLQVPVQTMSDDREELLTFRVEVTHWKVRGLAMDTYFLKAWWTRLEFETSEEAGTDIKWDGRWEFLFQSSVSELKDSNLTVMLLSTHKQLPLATLYIKQWDIATGPSMQNFPLVDKKGKSLGRISFHAHVRQETLLVLRPIQSIVTLTPEIQGSFSLAIKCVTEDSQESLVLPISEQTNWMFNEVDATTPSLCFPATIETLRNASLQVKLWRHKKSGKIVLLAECWLSFSQMFKQEKYTMIKRDGPGYKSFASKRGSEIDIDEVSGKLKSYSVTKSYNEKMMLCGKEVGDISGTMEMMNIPLLSQLISGVNTENGFMAQSSNFMENTMKTPKGNKPTLPLELQQIIVFTEELNATFSSGDQREGSLFSSKTADVREQINKVKELCTLLRSSKKQSMISFVYESKGDLIQAQNALLSTGEHFLKFADVTPYAVRPFYYEGLIHVLRRGELDLGALSLTEEDEKSIIKKMPGAVRYRSFLRSILSCALGKMKVKGVDKKTQQFTEFVCAVCYFRVPEYRRSFLSCIQEKDIGSLSEWPSENEEVDDIQTHILPMFDWEHLFYQFLPKDSEEDSKLRCLLEDVVWKRRVAKRGIAYFRLLAEWATHVRRLFLEKNVPWLEIPGYGTLVKSFLWELKSRSIPEYPPVLTLCSCSLLNNPDLLTLFLRILFHKVNVHSIEVTSEGLELLQKWFNQLYDSHRGLPITFDESYFIEGLKICLQCEVGMNVAKGLWLIYRSYHVFLPRMKQELVLDLMLNSDMCQLSHHWCQSVRQLYWSVLLYRLVSFKFLPFDLTPTVLDDMIYSRSVDLTNQILAGQDISLPSELEVYRRYARSELQRVQEGYEKWLERVQSDLSSSMAKSSYFGGLGVFPWPEITVENVFLDKSENAIQEEW